MLFRSATTGVCCPATMSNLLDMSSRDQENQSKTPPNSDTRAHSRRSHFRKATGPTKGKNSILPFIVFIMLCSVVNGDPPTALTSGLLNTAATGDTTIAGMCNWGHTSQTMTGMPQTVYVGMSSNSNVTDNIKIFSYDLSVACMASTDLIYVRALVIKGPGKVFAGSQNTKSRLLYTISHTAGTYTMTLTTTITSDYGYRACGDEDDTNNYAYVVSYYPTKINKIDMTTGVESPLVSNPSGPRSCAAGPGFNYIVITGIGIMVIRLKTDMSAVGTATRSGGPVGDTSTTTIDNLNAGMLYYMTLTDCASLVKADLNTATASVVYETMVWSVGVSYGGLDRPLNFGPYQYVVTLTTNAPSAYVLVMDKTSNTPAVTASFATGNGMEYGYSTIAGPMIDYSSGQFRAYITGIAYKANYNVHSYYLTVDPCSEINCIHCTYNKEKCSSCNTAWYLDTSLGQCRHPTIAPLIADGYGANLISGQIAACQVPNCQLCKSDHTKCLGCDTVSGWYMKKATDTCFHAFNIPVFPAGEGPRISDRTVQPCSDTHCKICTANYQTCTECGPKFKTSSGQCVKCIDSNCLTCSESVDICTECDSASNFELNGIKCDLRPSYINRDKKEEKITFAMPSILGVAAFIGTLVVTPFSYGAAFIAQTLTSQLLILATLDGPEVKRPEIVIRSVTHLARWFPTGNPFGTWGERASCQLSPTMERNQFTCSLVGNMGARIVMLLVIGFVCTFITVISIVVMAKSSPSSTKVRAVMSWIRSNFGISFVLSLGNAMHFELLFYSLHTFAKSSNTSVMIFSDLIGAIVIACLALFMAAQIYLAVWIWKQLKENARVTQVQREEQQSEPSAKKSVQLLGDTINLKSVPRGLGSFTCLFSEHSVPTRFFQLLIGSGLSVKNLMQSILILCASDKPVLQVSLVLVTELAYMGLYVISRPMASTVLFRVNVLNHSCMAIFMILKLASTWKKVSVNTREESLGYIMEAFVYIAILATSLYTLIACVQAISQLAQWIRGIRLSQFTPIKSEIPPSPPTESASLTKNAKNRGLGIFKELGEGDLEKIELRDFSNHQGSAGNLKGNNELHSLTKKKADHLEALELPHDDK